MDTDDLVKTIERVQKKKAAPLKEQMEVLLQHMRGYEKQTAPRIALTTSDGLPFVSTADIIYCESDSNYTKVILKEEKNPCFKTYERNR